jgi:hypothetical protein
MSSVVASHPAEPFRFMNAILTDLRLWPVFERPAPLSTNPLPRFPSDWVGPCVNPHVVHFHSLREGRGTVRVSRPVPADGDVEQEELILVEDPLFPGGQVRRRDGEKELVVQKPADALRLPFNAVEMEIVGESNAVAEHARAADPVTAGVTRAVNGAVNRGRLPPKVLDDVYLAARRPVNDRDVGAQHPKGGPDALTSRHLDARLDPAESPRRFAESF